jgi:hypothetical protein
MTIPDQNPPEPNKPYTWRDRLYDLILAAILFAVMYLVNEGLWLFDIIVVPIIAIILVPIKLIVMVRAFINDNLDLAKINFVVRWMLIISFLFLFFVYDFIALPHLMAYRFGVRTQGTAIGLQIKSKGTHFVTYKYVTDGGRVFSAEQEVMSETYESLKPDSAVEVYYLDLYPDISFLVDLARLKIDTWFALALGCYMMFVVNDESIKKHLTGAWQGLFAK